MFVDIGQVRKYATFLQAKRRTLAFGSQEKQLGIVRNSLEIMCVFECMWGCNFFRTIDLQVIKIHLVQFCGCEAYICRDEVPLNKTKVKHPRETFKVDNKQFYFFCFFRFLLYFRYITTPNWKLTRAWTQLFVPVTMAEGMMTGRATQLLRYRETKKKWSQTTSISPDQSSFSSIFSLFILCSKLFNTWHLTSFQFVSGISQHHSIDLKTTFLFTPFRAVLVSKAWPFVPFRFFFASCIVDILLSNNRSFALYS